jgi:nucleoside-diphosphate-sugar epimerase
MELFGHAAGRTTPPLVTRYAVWLMGRRCFFSSDKARRELSWQPTVGYDEGIATAVRWCLGQCPLNRRQGAFPAVAGN